MAHNNKRGGKNTEVNRAPVVEVLEPRILFSADLPGIELFNAETTSDPDWHEVVDNALAEFERTVTGINDDLLIQPSDSHDDSGAYELVIIDPLVEGYQTLIDSLREQQLDGRDLTWHVLDSERDGIEQLTELFSQHKNLSAVHLFAHGGDGVVQLGASQIETSDINSHASEVSSWRHAFLEDGDFLIYGCDLASSDTGVVWLETLIELTATDVAASENLTGLADQGGDWDLEYTHGVVEAQSVVSQAVQDSWQVRLDIPGVNDSPSFDTGDGTITTQFGAANDSAWSSAIQSDGKIIVVGRVFIGSDYDFAVARYNVDGSLDTSFSGDGMLTLDFNSDNDYAFDVTVQSDGKILVAGSKSNAGNNDFALVRFNTDGTLDTSFGGGDGIQTTAIGSGSDRGWSLSLQTDGKILLAGDSYNGSNDDFALVRYNTDGSLDTSFSGDGMLTTAVGAANDSAYAVTVQADGKILITGRTYNGSNFDIGVVRYNTNGTLDSSFSGDGIETTAIGTSDDVAASIAVQTDGKIVVAGESFSAGYEFAVVRYNTNGTLDTSFSGDGKLITDIGIGSSYGKSIGIQSDGQLVVAGYSVSGSDYTFAVARYNTDGTLDTSFDSDGVLSASVGSGNDFGRDLSIQSDGRILVVGGSNNGSDEDFGILSLSADGSLDTSFGLMGSLDGSPSYTEGGGAVVLDTDVNVSDAELDALNSSNGNYDGASVTLIRNGGVSSEDVFSFNDGNGITLSGTNLIKNSQTIATFDLTSTPGELLITWTDANGETPTSADVDNILRQITYANSSDSPPSSVQVDWTFNDGNVGSQGGGGALTTLGSSTISITPTNDAPVVEVYSDFDDVDNHVIDFEGGNNSVILTGLPVNVAAGTDVTVELWMKWDGTENVMVFGFNPYNLYFYDGHFGFNTFNSNDVYGISSASLAGDWHHISATFHNGDVTQSRLVIDGVEQVMSQQNSTPGAGSFVGSDARISGVVASSGYRFGGEIDEVRIWNGSRTEAEVRQNMYIELSDPQANLVASYSFTSAIVGAEGVIDNSGNGHHGTMNGMTNSNIKFQNWIVPDWLSSYTENDLATIMHSEISLSDGDDTHLESATVRISGGFQAGEDILEFTAQNGITGNFVGDTLTLSGSATIANYESALQSVTYRNNSDNPDVNDRTISWTINDGDVGSNILLSTLEIIAVNDNPINAGSLPNDITVTEDVYTFVDLSAIDLSDLDVGGGSLTVTLTTSTGGQLTLLTGSNISFGGSSNARTLTGKLSDLNSFFNNSSNIAYLHGTANLVGDNADTIQVNVNDNGNAGTGGGTDIDLGTVNVDIAAINDAPSSGEFGVYLSELTPLAQSNIYGGARFDTDYHGTPIDLEGVIYDYGITTHAPGGTGVGTIDYSIGDATRFVATLGVDDTTNTAGDVVFRVLVDGVEVYISDVLKKVDESVEISVDVTGGSVLRLEVGNADNHNGNDHAVWGNARLEGGDNALASIDENSANGTVVAHVTGNDVDSPDSFTFSLADDAGGRFAIDSTGEVSVADGLLLVYETNPSHSIDVLITDTDGAVTTQTLAITIANVDDETAAVVNQSTTVAEGATSSVLTTGDLSSTDTDTDDTTLIYTVADVSNGTLTINGGVWASGTNDSFTQQDIIDGNVLYTHDGSNTTADSFNYTVEDPSGNQLTGQVFGIIVTAVDDDVPSVVNQSATVAEGATNITLTVGDLSSSDTDTDDTTLIYTVGDVSNGTLTISGSVWASGTNDNFTQQDIIDGNVLYTHDGSNTTADSFYYTVEDPSGNQLGGQTFSVTVTATNDDPTNAGSLPTDISVTEDVVSNVDLSAIDLNDVDAGGSSLTVTLITSTGGDLTAAAGTGITIGGTSTALTLTGGLTDLNNYLNTTSNITYLHSIPGANGNDADTIQINVNDNGNTGTGGGGNIDFGTVNVDITAVNDVPTATADSYTLLEDGTLTTTLQLFGSEQVISNTSDGVVSVVAADVDGDGDLDVLVGSSLTDTVAWFENIDGFGTFGAEQVITNLADSVRSVKLVDIDGDGDIDVLVASLNDDTVAWFENTDGLGTFGSEQVITNLANGANSVTAADIDGDGDLDVLVASNVDDTVAWFENTDGLGVFGSEQVITNLADGANSVVATDVDGDGDLDVLIGSFNDDTVAWFENTDGLGAFGAEQVITLLADGVQAIESADVDGDGDQDVIVASRDDDTIAWFENTDGLGTFGVEQIIPGSSAVTRSLVAADVDGDGDLDLLAASFGNNTVGWFENTDGLGTFDAMQIIANSTDGARSVVAADMDGDGDLDVVVGSRNDDTVAWLENNGGPVLNNDIDIDVDPLTAVLVTNVSNGTLLLNADGTFTYTPDADFNGVDSFTYKVNDGFSDSNTVTVTLNVTAVNDDPTNTGSLPSDISVTEDVSSNVDLSAIDLVDVDASSGSLTVTLSTSTGGDLTAAVGTGVTVSGTSTELILTGNLTDLNNYLNIASNITYLHGTPETDGDNADTIQINVNDNGNIGTGGGTDIDLGTANVDITAVNDAPSSGEFGIYLSTLTPLAQAGIHNDAKFDTDYSGNSIVVEGVTYDHGVLTHAPASGVGTIDYAIDGATRFVATLGIDNNAGSSGDVVFRVLVDGVELYNSGTIRKSDGSIEISVDVTGGSVLQLEISNADNDQDHDHAVWANARLEGGDASVVNIDENSANAAVVAYVTGNDIDSPDSFSYSLVDDAGGRFAINAAGEVTVADGALLDFETNTSHTIDVIITDLNGAFTTQTLTIAVADVDEYTPNVVNQSTTVPEGATNVPLTSGDLSSADTDTDDTTLIYTVGDVSNGTLTISGSVWASGTNDSFTQQDIIDGNVLYSHDDSNTTNDSFSYTVEDPSGNQLTGQTFSVAVTAVDDDVPTIVNQSTTVAEGATNITLTTGDLSSTDTDTDDTTLIYIVGDVSNGTLTINGSAWVSGTNDSFTQQDILDSNVLYSHDDSNTTSDSFSYTIEDPTGNTLSGQTFSITVTAVDDDTATMVSQSATVAEGATNIALSSGDLSSTDTDTNDTTLIYTVADVSNGTLTINGSVWASGTNDSFTQQDINDGNVLYTHDGSNTIADSFTYIVEDPSGNQLAGQAFGITVIAVDDDIPTVVNQSTAVVEGATNIALTSGDLSSTDADTDDTTLIYTVADVSNGTLTINGSVWTSGTNDSFTQQDTVDGKVLYTHDDSNTTSDSFGYTVEDPSGNQLAGQTFSITITAVDDDTPIAVSQSTTVVEGATNIALTIGDLSSSDTDTVDSTLIYTVGDVSNGTLTINGSAWASGTNDSFSQQDIIDGNVLYSHDDSNATSDSFSYTVEDPSGNRLIGQIFGITITSVDDDTPTVGNQSTTVAEGAANIVLTIGDLSSSDTDTDDTTLIYTVGDVSNGTLTINGSAWAGGTNDSFTQQDIIDGNVLYTHDDSNTTSDSFSYTVEDPSGNQLTGQTFGITITAVDDDTPTVINQSTTVAEGVSNIALSSGDLSSTDTDTGDTTLIYTVADVSNGTLTINGSVWASGTNDSFTQQDIVDGNVLYSHDDSNTTSDSFSYMVEDPAGNQLTGQTFGITVTAVDDDTPSVDNQSTTVNEGVSNSVLTTGDLSSTDTDTGDTTLIYTVADVSNGTLTINGSVWASGTNDSFTQQDIVDGNVLYSHDDSNTTSDSFSYMVEDPAGNQLTGQTFGITVTAVDDDTPSVDNQSTTVNEGVSNSVLTTGDLSSTDTDTDDTTLIYTVADVSNGTLIINGSVWASGTNDSFTQQDITDGNILYTHDGSNATADSFSYTVEDLVGNTLSGQTFGITVAAVDDDAPIVINQSTTVSEGVSNSVLTTGDLLSTDTDTDDTTLIYTVADVSNGILTINGSVWAGGTNDSFTQQDIIDGNVLYSHDDSNTTSDSFSYMVEDPAGNQLTGQTFGITVTAVDDDTPSVDNQSTTVAEGATNIALSSSDLSSTDSDTDNTTLIYTVADVSNGTLIINGSVWASGTNDSFTQQDIIDGNVLYSHDDSNTMSDGFTYTVEDPAGNQLTGQTFAITVTAVDDDTATVVNQSTTVAEGVTNFTLTAGDLSSNDTDTDDTTLIYTVADVMNGTLTINGSVWAGGTNDSFTQQDIIDGNVLYSHDGSNTTSDSFTYTVEDPAGNQLAGQSFSLTITAVDDDIPTAVNQSTTVTEGATNIALSSGDLSSIDTDTDDTTLIYTVGDVSNGTLTINGSVWASGTNDSFTQQDIIDGNIRYTHDDSNTTADDFTYTVEDPAGNQLAGQTFGITIIAVDDDAATVVNQSTTVAEGATNIALSSGDLSSTDSDTDNTTLIYTVADVSNGTLTISGSVWASGTNDSFTQQDIIDGNVLYTHDGSNTATDGFTYTVEDPAGNQLTGQTFAITVTAVDDDTATVVNQSTTVAEGATNIALSIGDLSSTDSDTDNTTLIYTVGDVSNGTLTISGSVWASGTNDSFTQQDIIDGNIRYTHDDSNTTADDFTYTVEDPSGNQLAGQTFGITITAVDDDTPTVINQSTTVAEGATNIALSSGDLSSTDSDTDNTTLIYTVADVSNGALIINGSVWASGSNDSFTQQDIIDGNILYTHDDSNTTSDSFSYTVEDPSGNRLAGQNFGIAVTAVDDDTATVVNQSTAVVEGESNTTLTTGDLSSTDTDTDDTTLIYTVGNVSSGTLTINGSVWASSTNDSFTQQDIIDGNVLYTHDGSNTTNDGFSYRIEDLAENQLAGQAFGIAVTSVDDDTPASINQSTTVAEGASNVVLTSSDLSSTDSDTDDTTLIYTVGDVSNGRLTINGSAWAGVTNDSFTQRDIIDGNVLYSHDGSKTTSDSFSYTVEDPTGNTLSGQKFSVTVSAVEYYTPTVVNQSTTILEGENNVVIDTIDLSSTDSDTDDTTLIYTVGNVSNGTLIINGSIWASGSNDSFTQQDIIDGNVQYAHNGSNASSDSFIYTLKDTDGNILEGQIFSISVSTSVPSDIEPPDSNLPPTLGQGNETDENTGPESSGISHPSTSEPGNENQTDPGPESIGPNATGSNPDRLSGIEGVSENTAPLLVAESSGKPSFLGGLLIDPISIQSSEALSEVLAERSSNGVIEIQVVQKSTTLSFLQELNLVWSQASNEQVEEERSIHNDTEFMQDLEHMRRSIDKSLDDESRRSKLTSETVIGLGIGLSACLFSWMFRAGSLLASFLSVMPVWRNFDPLPVLSTADSNRNKVIGNERRKDDKSSKDQDKQLEGQVEDLFTR